jgi:hypothetical protein
MRTNKRTDVTKLTVAFRNFANAPKNSHLLPAADAGARPFCSQAHKITSFKYIFQLNEPKIALRSTTDYISLDFQHILPVAYIGIHTGVRCVMES